MSTPTAHPPPILFSRQEGTMQAALQERYGPPEVVRVTDVERPVPEDDEVLVRVRAASVNRADLDGLGPRPGFVRLFLGMRAPRNHRMGIDVAGVVESVGAERDPVPARRRGLRRPVPVRRGRLRRVRVRRRRRRSSRCRRACRSRTRPRSRTRRSWRSRGSGCATAGRSRPGDKVADRRCIGQRRPVRRPDREVAWAPR